jgi:hypothetical protein
MQLSDIEKAAIDRDNRQYNVATAANFSDLLQNQILNPLEQSAAGIIADARDVNGVALAGIVVTRDKTTGPGTSLVFAWRTFKYWKNAPRWSSSPRAASRSRRRPPTTSSWTSPPAW